MGPEGVLRFYQGYPGGMGVFFFFFCVLACHVWVVDIGERALGRPLFVCCCCLVGTMLDHRVILMLGADIVVSRSVALT